MTRARRSATYLVALAGVMSACGPSAEHVLVVYSPLPQDVLEYAEDRFEGMWANVDVRMVQMSDGDAMERIGSGRGDGDVWWGAEAGTLSRAAADSLLATYRPQWVTEDSPFAGADAADRWQAAMYSPLVIAFNREVTQLARAPRDWADLYHPRWRGETLLPDPANGPEGSAFVEGMIGERLTSGDDLVAAFDRLLRIDATADAYSSDAESAVGALGSEDALIAVLPLHEAERLRHDRDEWLHYRHPDSGTPVVIRGVAMLHGAPEPEWAEEFIEMVGGDVAAEVAARTWWLPAGRPVFAARMPEDHFLPGEARPWFRVPATPADERATWLERWESEVRGKGRSFY